MSSTEDSGTPGIPFAPLVNKYAEFILAGLTTSDFQEILKKLSGLPTVKENLIPPYPYSEEGPYDFDKIPGIANIVSAYASLHEHAANFQKVTLPEIISLSKDIQDYLGKAISLGDSTASSDSEIFLKALTANFKPEDLNQLVKRTGDLVASIVKFLQISLNDKENLQTSYEQSSTGFDEGNNSFLGSEVYLLRQDLLHLVNITASLQALWVSVLSGLQNIKQDIDVALIKAKASQVDYFSYFSTALESIGAVKFLIDNYNLSALTTTSKAP